jgi:hypothetical protein
VNNSGIVREGFAREKVADHKGSSRSQLGSPIRKVFKIQIILGIESRDVIFFQKITFLISADSVHNFICLFKKSFCLLTVYDINYFCDNPFFGNPFGELGPAFLFAPTYFESRL